MKNDITTTFLNFVLAALVVLGVVLAYFNMKDTHDLRYWQPRGVDAGNKLSRIQALFNDASAYNAQAKSLELAQILQRVATPPPAK